MELNDVYGYVNELLLKKIMYQAIIVSGDNQKLLNECAHELSRMLVCENNSLSFDDCAWCVKANKSLLSNVVELGDANTEIKKTSVSTMIREFNTSNIEQNDKRIYIVKNAENLNLQAANAILKFLEEPTKNTFAIFLTIDRNAILQTIRSRCKFLTLNTCKKEYSKSNNLTILIDKKQKQKILLYGQVLKKQDKEEVLDILEVLYNYLLIKGFPSIAEKALDLIRIIQKGGSHFLAIEDLLISISEVI